MNAPPLPYAVELLHARLGRWRAAMRDRVSPAAQIAGGMPACFVVGCGNSGTTLLASRLGLHPAIYTVPVESTAFRPHRRLAYGRDRLLRWMAEAEAAGASQIVEKTPRHVHTVHRIWALLPEARIVAVVRNPFDTVLSLRKRLGGGVDHGIARWRVANQAVRALAHDDRTLIVAYEALTADPKAELGRVLGFLGLPWDERVLVDGETPYRPRRNSRTLKLRVRQVAEPIRSNSGKWRSELTRSETERIRRRTAVLWSALGGDPQTGEWRSVGAVLSPADAAPMLSGDLDATRSSQ